MSSNFNPYHEWLQVQFDGVQPNHYQLLGLSELESDSAKIVQAAGEKLSLLRSVRPGEHINEWTRLIDELNSAKTCLTDATSKAAYDLALQNGQPLPTPTAAPPTATPPAAVPTTAAPPSATPPTTTPPVATTPPIAKVIAEAPLQSPPPAATIKEPEPKPEFSGVQKSTTSIGRRKKSKLPILIAGLLTLIVIVAGILIIPPLLKSDPAVTDTDGRDNQPDQNEVEVVDSNQPNEVETESTNSDTSTSEATDNSAEKDTTAADNSNNNTSDDNDSSTTNNSDKTESADSNSTNSASSNAELIPAVRQQTYRILSTARQAMVDGDLSLAQEKIESAIKLSRNTKMQQLVDDHLATLELVTNLTEQVEEQCMMLETTQELPIGNIIIRIVESKEGKLAFRTDGAESFSFPYAEIPPKLKLAILNQTDSIEPVDKSKYQAVLYVTNSWENPFLEEKAVTKINGVKGQVPEVERLVDSEMFEKLSPAFRTGPKPVPPKNALREARLEAAESHELSVSRIRNKTQADDQANNLLEASYSASSDALRYVLLESALRIAWKSGNPVVVDEILRETNHHFEIDIAKESSESIEKMIKEGFRQEHTRRAIKWIMTTAEYYLIVDKPKDYEELLQIAQKLAQDSGEFDLAQMTMRKLASKSMKSGSLRLD